MFAVGSINELFFNYIFGQIFRNGLQNHFTISHKHLTGYYGAFLRSFLDTKFKL